MSWNLASKIVLLNSSESRFNFLAQTESWQKLPSDFLFFLQILYAIFEVKKKGVWCPMPLVTSRNLDYNIRNSMEMLVSKW